MIISHPNVENNLNLKETKALKEFRNQDTFLFANADKNLGITIIKRTTYTTLMDKALAKLSDTYRNSTNIYRIPIITNLQQQQKPIIADAKKRAYILDLYMIRYKHINYYIRKILKQLKIKWLNKEQLIKDMALAILAKQRITYYTRSQLNTVKAARERQLLQCRNFNITNNIGLLQTEDVDNNRVDNNNITDSNNISDIKSQFHRTVQLTDDKFLYQIIHYNQIPVPTLIGLPKIHKSPLNMRLIIPFNQHILNNLHIFIAKALEHITIKMPRVVAHSIQIIDQLVGQNNYYKEWDPKHYLFKADIISMYPNINLSDALGTAAKRLSSNTTATTLGRTTTYNTTTLETAASRLWPGLAINGNACNQLSEREWFTILSYAHYRLELQWQEDIWTCINGVPMGSPCGPHIATIGIQSALDENLHIINANTNYYGSYLDDHFGIALSPPINWIHKIIPTPNQSSL